MSIYPFSRCRQIFIYPKFFSWKKVHSGDSTFYFRTILKLFFYIFIFMILHLYFMRKRELHVINLYYKIISWKNMFLQREIFLSSSSCNTKICIGSHVLVLAFLGEKYWIGLSRLYRSIARLKFAQKHDFEEFFKENQRHLKIAL